MIEKEIGWDKFITFLFTATVLQYEGYCFEISRARTNRRAIQWIIFMSIKIEIKKKPIARGHSQHRSGAGTHIDKRYKRQRTRATQQRKAIEQ
jgi:hypothetical protein